MTRELIETYADGGQTLHQSIAGLTSHDLLATPVPGKWSTHVLLLHLADAEAAFADRIRRIIATDGATLLAWDENLFLQHLHYEKQSADDAVTMIDLTRRQLARVLKVLPDSAFTRVGIHSERGPQTLETVINFAIFHLNHHLKFIEEKRKALGK